MYEKAKILGPNSREKGLSELPVAVISQGDMDLIFGFVLNNYPYEINGRGYVYREENFWRIRNVFILPQETSIGSVDEQEDAIHKYMFENINSGFDFDKMNFQWHSHPDKVYFSTKDQKNARKLGQTMDFLLSLVVNNRFEYYCRLDIFNPVELSIQIPLIVTHEIGDETMQFCQSEIEEKVTKSGMIKIREVISGKPKTSIRETAVISLDDIEMEE